MSFEDATRLAVDALGRDNASGEVRQLTTDALEVAVLDRNRMRRKFKRIPQAKLRELLGNGDAPPTSGPDASAEPAAPSTEEPTEEPPAS
jgi:proteasome alpha subunit